MKISVIIPSCRPHSYLWECLDSVSNQTFPKEEYETIIVLNGCREPYESQIKGYIESHPFNHWRYLQIDQGGVSNARNVALDIAEGEYITFVDDDDYITPTYLEELYEKADLNTISLCYPLSFKDGSDKTEPYYITADYEKWSGKGKVSFHKARRYFNGPCYKLIHKDIIGDRRFDVHLRIGEDSLFMFLISDRFDKVGFTSKEAVYYRRFRSDSATTRTIGNPEILKTSFYKIKSVMGIFFSKKGYKARFCYTMIRGSLFSMTKMLLHNFCSTLHKSSKTV